jgi:hypothetical protein
MSEGIITHPILGSPIIGHCLDVETGNKGKDVVMTVIGENGIEKVVLTHQQALTLISLLNKAINEIGERADE